MHGGGHRGRCPRVYEGAEVGFGGRVRQLDLWTCCPPVPPVATLGYSSAAPGPLEALNPAIAGLSLGGSTADRGRWLWARTLRTPPAPGAAVEAPAAGLRPFPLGGPRPLWVVTEAPSPSAGGQCWSLWMNGRWPPLRKRLSGVSPGR